MKRSAKAVIMKAAVAAAAVLLLAVLSYRPAPLWSDDYHYLLLAKSIAANSGYLNIYEPDTPPHTQYPPAYPAILAVVSSVTGENYHAFKFVSVAFAAWAAAMTVIFLAQSGSAASALAATLCMALTATAIHFSGSVLSEPAFCAILMTALAILGAFPETISGRRFVAGAILAASLFLIRSAGLFVIMALVIYLLMRKAFARAVLFTFIAVIIAAPWIIHSDKNQSGVSGSYKHQILLNDPYNYDEGLVTPAGLAVRAAKNTITVALFEIPQLIVPPAGQIEKYIDGYSLQHNLRLTEVPSAAVRQKNFAIVSGIALLAVLSLSIMLFLIRSILRRGLSFEIVLLIVYSGLTMLWPSYWLDIRLFLPLFGIFWWLVLEGITTYSKGCEKRAAIIRIAFVALMVTSAMPAAAQRIRANTGNHGELATFARNMKPDTGFFEAVEWLRGNTPPDSLVASREPAVVFYHSSRQGRFYPFSEHDGVMCDYFLDGNYSYVINDTAGTRWQSNLGSGKKFLTPFIMRHGNSLQKVFSAADRTADIYRIDHTALEKECKSSSPQD